MLTKLKQTFRSPSLLVIFAIIPFVLGVHNNLNVWKSKSVIKWDVISYYSYLPATFIEKDLKLGFINDSTKAHYIDEQLYWPQQLEGGKKLIKASMGMSAMYAPFFFIANATTSDKEDGFSPSHHLAVLLSGLFYLVIGLFYLRKTLLLFYSEKITALTLIILYFGTNLLCYSTLHAAMSHEYNFFLFSMFIWFSIKWHKQQNVKYILALGLIMGMMILVRPVNVLLMLFFVLYGISDMATFKERLSLLFKHFLQMLLFGSLCILLFVPQMMYWKYVTGSYWFNSYIGEQFYFAKAHLIDCLVGFRKGWLIYTPMMALALVGIWHLKKIKSPFFVATLILIPFYFYIISSWWCWWYGGSFGLRAMIDLYPLLAFALAAFLQAVLFQKKASSKIIGVSIVIFIALNLFQTIQYHYNIIHYDAMNMKAYFNSFGKTSKADCDRTLLKSPDYAKAMKGESEQSNNTPGNEIPGR